MKARPTNNCTIGCQPGGETPASTRRRTPKPANPLEMPTRVFDLLSKHRRLACECRTLCQGLELRPRDLRMRAAAEPAIAAGDDVFLADAIGEALDALRNDFRMLDDIGGVRHHAGD